MNVRDYLYRMRNGFPDASDGGADDQPLCVGGNLSVPLLLAAYSRGIFPWYNAGDPILWWTPAPRCVMLPEKYHLLKRSARTLRKQGFHITLDQAFPDVIASCGNVRKESGTWITESIEKAYTRLFEAGYVHSVEAWQDEKLVGGLYGIALGRAFFGESMFHLVSEASRACLKALTDLLKLRGVTILDCQQEAPHIMAQGGMLLSRRAFEDRLEDALALKPDACDALTAEYADPAVPLPWKKTSLDLTGNALQDAWPFLPWRTRYVHDGTAWQALSQAENAVV